VRRAVDIQLGGRILGTVNPRIALAAMLAGACLAGATASQAPAPARQPEQPTFRAGVTLVQLEVTVVDKAGGPVSGLTRDDFRVFENGAPQVPVAFDAIEPAPPSDPAVTTGGVARGPRVGADIASNANAGRGGVFVLALDDLHTAMANAPKARAAARLFVQRTRPDDLVAVIHTSGRPEASQDFTSDRALLLAAIDRFVGKKVISPVRARLEQIGVLCFT